MWDIRYDTVEVPDTVGGKTVLELLQALPSPEIVEPNICGITLNNIGGNSLNYQIAGTDPDNTSGTLLAGQATFVPGNKAHLDNLKLIYQAPSTKNVMITQHGMISQ